MPAAEPPSAESPDFEIAWALADRVPGWLTRDQGRLLFDEATAAGSGARLLEIGSHQGRSTVLLGRVALASGGEVVAIDPFVEGRLFGGTPTRERFRAMARAAMPSICDFSQSGRSAPGLPYPELIRSGSGTAPGHLAAMSAAEGEAA